MDKTYLTAKDLKPQEKYYFVDTKFEYISVPIPVIKERTVYRIVDDAFSTKEKEDRFEVERYKAYKTLDDAKQSAKESLAEYKKYINKQIDNTLAMIEGE